MQNSTTPQGAKQYQAMKNRLFLFNLVLNFAFLLVLLFTGWSRSLKIWLLNFRADFFSINALYFFVFSALGFILSFPLEFYEGFVLEHTFGLSRQNFKNWFKDLLKKSGIVLFVSLVMVEVVYFFLSRFSQTWWLWAAAFWFFISVVLTRIYPKVILPLFFHSKPLETGELRSRIFSLLEKYKIRLKDVYSIDFSKKTVKANAMVTGLGATKQIFLSDTLVDGFPYDEIEVVLAHELGHYISRDTIKLALASLCSALFSFFFAGILLDRLLFKFGFCALSDIAGLPLLLSILILMSLILLPLQNSYARFLEEKADDFALKATGNPKSFISMIARLGEKNFSEFSPSRLVEFFLYDHPPISKRIAKAQMYLAGENKNAV